MIELFSIITSFYIQINTESNNMKTRYVFFALLFSMVILSVNAQMAAAKKIPPAIIMNVLLNQPADTVWNYISNPEHFKEYMGFKDVKCYEGRVRDANVYITFEDGNEREQIISVLKEDDKQINFFVQKSHYMKDKWGYAYKVYPRGKNKANVELSLYVMESEIPNFKLKEMEQEFKTTTENLKAKFNKK